MWWRLSKLIGLVNLLRLFYPGICCLQRRPERLQNFFKGANNHIGPPVEYGDIMCLPMELVGGEDAKTFSEYYSDEENPAHLENVIQKLFKQVLRRPELAPLPCNRNVFRVYRFDDPTKLEHNLQDISEKYSSEKGDHCYPPLTFWWDRFALRCPDQRRSAVVLSHGDLHGKNILVSSEENVYVIDFGKTELCHVMLDLAKLEREIALILYSSKQPDVSKAIEQLELALTKSPDVIRSIDDLELQKACRAIQVIRQLAQEEGPRSGIDWKFEYQVALFAYYIFAAGNDRLPIETRMGAYYLSLASKMKLQSFSFLKESPEDKIAVLVKKREAALARLSLAFLRLDQLPSGGWSKTLHQWMEAIWEGDNGKIPRNPAMRKDGGTDLTCYAFWHYCSFLKKLVPEGRIPADFLDPVANKAKENISKKIGYKGGIGVEWTTRGQPSPIRLRHSAMALMMLLQYGKSHSHRVIAFSEIDKVVSYLLGHLELWKKDKSYLFGMFTIFVKLSEILSNNEINQQITNSEKLKKLLNKLNISIITIGRQLLSETNFDPKPEGTVSACDIGGPFFPAYNYFWRMQRSGFLMYFPFLLTEDEENLIFLPQHKKFGDINQGLRDRYGACFERLLSEIEVPCSSQSPQNSLIYYYGNVGESQRLQFFRPRDWGLSADLAALLELPAVRKLITDKGILNDSQLNEKRQELESALCQTFDQYLNLPGIFKFTHGVSFSRYLRVLHPTILDVRVLKNLNVKLGQLVVAGVTEKGLEEFIQENIATHLAISGDDVKIHNIREMLVEKLESGEYTPDDYFCLKDSWEKRVQEALSSTLSFFDSSEGEKYVQEYLPNPFPQFVTRILELSGWNSGDSKMALDVGCGPGYYASILKKEGFSVELLDISTTMLKIASEKLGLSEPPIPRNLYSLRSYFKSQIFDLIFASGIMAHVQRGKAPGIYKDFFHLLKPGGWLFVNFKLKDHALISREGSFFEYYSDYSIPQTALQSEGFRVEEATIRSNRLEIDYPKTVRWVNFFCQKPD